MTQLNRYKIPAYKKLFDSAKASHPFHATTTRNNIPPEELRSRGIYDFVKMCGPKRCFWGFTNALDRIKFCKMYEGATYGDF
jgi:hypothetical protein